MKRWVYKTHNNHTKLHRVEKGHAEKWVTYSLRLEHQAHVTLMFTSRPFCNRLWHMYSTDIHFSPILTAVRFMQWSRPDATVCRRYKKSVNIFDSFVCRAEDTTLLQKKRRKGVMTEAECFTWAYVLSACALQRRAVRRPRGSFSVTSLSEPTMALMAPGKKSCCSFLISCL